MKALAAAATLVALHLAMRVLGFAEHTSVLAGMPATSESLVIGPLYVLVHLLAVIASPILALAGVMAFIADKTRRIRVRSTH